MSFVSDLACNPIWGQFAFLFFLFFLHCIILHHLHQNSTNHCTAWKESKYGVFSSLYFPVFGLNIGKWSPNKGKYGPEKTPYLDTFHAVLKSVHFSKTTNQNVIGNPLMFFCLSLISSLFFTFLNFTCVSMD